ncbi:MAG: TetR/AcrR family transcriptional regulator [Proteobacteria bacterium]|nr:TetR/AcrR family transcriptional regulator [Pseudomonadota bacterium]
MPRNSEASQKKIMEVAVKIFASKGFDGARVDEIAREAKVNKALIYYYFKSKSLILEEIFRVFHSETAELIISYFQDKTYLDDSQWLATFFDEFMTFLEERKDIIKILITESLKSNEKEPPIFGFMNLIFQQDIEKYIQSMKNRGFHMSEDKEQMMVTEFFTDIIPILSYVVFKDKWSRLFKIDKERLKNMFFEAYSSTHLAYHLGHHNKNT